MTRGSSTNRITIGLADRIQSTEPGTGRRTKQIQIDRDHDKPLFLQIVEEVERLVAQGHIPDGHRMPPTRELARQLGVNRNTVVAAYHELDLRGRTTAHTGRGTFVRADAASGRAGIPWDDILGQAAHRRALNATLDL